MITPKAVPLFSDLTWVKMPHSRHFYLFFGVKHSNISVKYLNDLISYSIIPVIY